MNIIQEFLSKWFKIDKEKTLKLLRWEVKDEKERKRIERQKVASILERITKMWREIYKLEAVLRQKNNRKCENAFLCW